MPSALITSMDPKGRRIGELVDAALNRAEITEEEAQRVIEYGGGLQDDFVAVLRSRANSFVVALSDADIISRYPTYEGLVPNYRRMLRGVWDITDDRPIARRVYKGFTLRDHAPKSGHCFDDFGYLKNWRFEDTPTSDSLVFGVHLLVPNSTSKKVSDQMKLLADLRREYKLPSHHLSNFGSATLNAALILEEFKRTQSHVPLNNLAIRTDTLHEGGNRLCLSWSGDGRLDCDYWRDVDPNGDLGCYALGVETLGR